MSISFIMTLMGGALFVRQFFGAKGDFRHIGRGIMVGVLTVGAVLYNTFARTNARPADNNPVFMAHIFVGCLFFVCLLCAYLTGIALKRNKTLATEKYHLAAVISSAVFLFWTIALAVGLRFGTS